MPRGGKREGAGRKKGTPNRLPFDIQKEAEARAAKAMGVFDQIFNSRKVSPLTKLAAADKIFDRAFGKPVQSTQMVGPDGKVVAPTFVQIVAATDEDVQKALGNASDSPHSDESEGKGE